MPDITIGRLGAGFCVTWRKPDGKRARHRLAARTRKDAEAEAIDVWRRTTTPATGLTTAAIWAEYLRDRAGRPIAATMAHTGKALLPHFGALRPDQITVADCRAYTAARRAAGRSDGTIWTELGHLRTVMLWAADIRIIAHAPRIERPAKPAPKDRYLTRVEIDRLLDAPAAPHIRLAILLLLSTAGRVAAILDLTWDRVDFERDQINLRSDLTGPRKGRATVPMNAGLRAALTEARRGALTDYVIEWAGGPVRSVRKGFSSACAAAGLSDISLHVLRHTAAVHMVEAGISMDEVAQFLGHSNPSITFRVYGRFSPDHLRKAADVIDFTRVRAVREGSAN